MPELLRMPEISASTTEATLSQWPVSENTPFSAKDVIATVETDKALVDVEAEADGVILRTLVAEGTQVPVGTAIALLGQPGEDLADLDATLASLGIGTPAAGVAQASDTAPPAPATPAAPAVNGTDRRFASPIARRLATEAGLLLTDIDGSGPGGRIVRRDVEAAITNRVALEEVAPAEDTAPGDTAPMPAPVQAPVREPVPVTTQGGQPWTDEPLSRMRKGIAARLSASKSTAPHFYLRGSARVDRLLALRTEINEGSDIRISVNDLVVKAVARAHRLVPAMNVIWTGDAIRSFAGVDVAVAVATPGGLVTPVVRDVDHTSVTAVARTMKDFIERAKTARLQQHELEGGAVTVTNLGMYGTDEFAAILNPPQSAILAVGAATSQPVVVDGGLEVGTVMRVTLSVDHRPVDGATAADWMRTFIGLLEAPVRILA